jgi:hypothetical protein
VVMVVAIIIWYVAPNASLAAWHGWRFLALSRGQWETVLAVSALLAGSLFVVRDHVNRRRRRRANAKRPTDRKKRWYKWPMIAVVMIVLLRGCAELDNVFEAYWANVYAPPPRHCGGWLTLREFATRLDVEPDQAADALRREGFPVNDLDRTIAEIARMRYARPVDVYNAVRAISPPVNTPGGSPRTPQTSPAP